MAGRFGRKKAAQCPMAGLLFIYKSMGYSMPERQRSSLARSGEVARIEARQGLGVRTNWAKTFRPTFYFFMCSRIVSALRLLGLSVFAICCAYQTSDMPDRLRFKAR